MIKVSSQYSDLFFDFAVFANNSGPSHNPFSCGHSVEVAFASVSVGPHGAQAEPVTHLSINWDIDAFGDNIHSITSHSEKC